VLPAQAIERLRAAGGKANGTVRGVGKLLGVRSKTTAHRILHQLADAGLITVAAGRHGVSIALA
jgi:DNA-binding IclR family transcriptional regulator